MIGQRVVYLLVSIIFMQRSEEWMKVRIDKLKENVQMLFNNSNGKIQIMNLVDVVQRLGIDHLFEVSGGATRGARRGGRPPSARSIFLPMGS